MKSFDEILNFAEVKKFYENHVQRSTYYVQGSVGILIVNSLMHYMEFMRYWIFQIQSPLKLRDFNITEKFLPSKLENPKKRAQHLISCDCNNCRECWIYD